MHSNTGDPRVYEAGDQRFPKITGPEKGRHPERELSPRKADIDIEGLDERAIGEALVSLGEKEIDPEENRKTVRDPLARALVHGNQPSRGAQIDAQLKAEDEQTLRKKGKI